MNRLIAPVPAVTEFDSKFWLALLIPLSLSAFAVIFDFQSAVPACWTDNDASHDDMLASLEDEASHKEHIDHHGEVQEDDENGEEGGEEADANAGADDSAALDGVRHHTTKSAHHGLTTAVPI